MLFPGKVDLKAFDRKANEEEEYKEYYYHVSNRNIGIGAFPLRPGESKIGENGEIIIDPSSSEHALRTQIRTWLEEENGRERLLEGAIAQKGLEYHREGEPSDKDLVLVGYYKDDTHLHLIKGNMLYYVPAALGKGSINLVSGFEKTKYLLLHHKEERILLRLKGEGPKFYPKTELENMGFSPNGNYYLGFEISSLNPIPKIDPYKYKLERRNQGEQTSYFTTIDRLK